MSHCSRWGQVGFVLANRNGTRGVKWAFVEHAVGMRCAVPFRGATAG